MNAKEILIKARDLILERGWGQHEYESRSGCLCSYGALYTAAYGESSGASAGSSPNASACEIARGALLDVMHRKTRGGVVWFNDTPGRKAEEVVEVFNEAIAKVSA